MRAQVERREVNCMLVDMYNAQNNMEPSIQQLLCQDVTEHLLYEIGYLQQKLVSSLCMDHWSGKASTE